MNESISVCSLGIEQFGFIDESFNYETEYSSDSLGCSSDSSDETQSFNINDEDYLGDNETDDSETDSTSDSSSPLSDSSANIETQYLSTTDDDICDTSDSSYSSSDSSDEIERQWFNSNGEGDNETDNSETDSTSISSCFSIDISTEIEIQSTDEVYKETQSNEDYEEWLLSTKNDPIWRSSIPSIYPSRTLERLGNYIPILSRSEADYLALYYGPFGSFVPQNYQTQAPSPVNNLYQNSPVSIDYVHLSHNPETTEMWIINSNNLSKLITEQYWCTSLRERIRSTSEYIMVERIIVNNKMLTEAACSLTGLRTLQRLIRSLNKSNLAILLTQSLAYGCYNMMLDNFGWRVIQQCFNVFDSSANEVLYEGVIRHCLDLAKDKKGCLSINACINAIKGPHRDMLLDAITDHSLYLVNNQYGTFVIQHILLFEEPKFCNKICELLKGNYVSLSQVDNGSHVVEKCLQKSDFGLKYLMVEIIDEPYMLDILARHEFGNYVIQQALIISKDTNIVYHQYLFTKLWPLLPILENIKYGKKLATLLQEIARHEKIIIA